MSRELTLLKQYLDSDTIKNRIFNLFDKDSKKVEKFKSALINISLSANLSGCTADSILRSALSIAELGLDINKVLGQAYIVKYKKEAEAVIGYKGWQTLIERTGKSVKAYSVFKCDNFKMDLSDFDEKITFEPNFDERRESNDDWYISNLSGILVKLKDFRLNNVKNYFVTLSKLEKIRGMSPSKASQYSPYVNWAEEMYLAKAIKYVLSRQALNFDELKIAEAIQVDNELDIKLQDKNLQDDNNVDIENFLFDNKNIDEVKLEEKENE